MSGDAAQWYALLERNHGQPSCPDFIKLVNQRFGSPLRSNLLEELIQLRNETTVVEYQSQFLALLARCDDLVEKHQIHIFTVNLGNPLCTDVELEHPTTLDDAMALARIYKQCLAMGGDSTVRTSAARSTMLRTMTAASAHMPCLKRLTVEEMAAKRERGECYKCSKKFTGYHFKVCLMKGIYLIELDEEDYSAEPDADTPQISLHAITGISSVETMKLRVCLSVAFVDALVDSESTHSFISMATACRLHLYWICPNNLKRCCTRFSSTGATPNLSRMSSFRTRSLLVLPQIHRSIRISATLSCWTCRLLVGQYYASYNMTGQITVL
jgi:hypothetical protein